MATKSGNDSAKSGSERTGGQGSHGRKGGKGAASRGNSGLRTAPGGGRVGTGIAWALVGLVVVAVAVLVVVKITKSPSSSGFGLAPQSVVQPITSVPTSVLDQVGLGSPSNVSSPMVLSAPPVTYHGLPAIFYFGAEYCPYCAAERWPLAIALSRFGTFSKLGLMKSSSTDSFPSTNTLSFHGSSYKSKYISFLPVESQDRNHKNLDAPNVQELRLVAKYDAAPYVPNASPGNGPIPFIDFGGNAMLSGASYTPQVLTGQSWQHIAALVSLPGSDVAQNVDATANFLIGAICLATNNQPASVCSDSIITKAESTIQSTTPSSNANATS